MKYIFLLPGLLILMLSATGFMGNEKQKRIRKKDLHVAIPPGFPKPVYDRNLNPPTPNGFVLGRKLFYDPILSKDSSTSCGSCHQRFAAFAHIDHSLSHGIRSQIGNRNVPAIQNVIWQPHFMWDGGVNHLDVFPIAPITHPKEMDQDLPGLLTKLQASKTYPALFKKAFGDGTVSTERTLKAIAQFTQMLVSVNSKYDRYVAGKESLTEQEMTGLTLFRNRCSSCHPEPLFTDYSFRNIGLLPDSAIADSGRAHITGQASDRSKFKVPSLRNVEMTYPYMHDGRFKNLQQVLEHYGKGKFHGDNVDPDVKLNVGLTRNQRADLVAFLKTLTDTEFLNDERFGEPEAVDSK
ncbi:MAG TPA: cytochrome c peroxidase [Catalimonadaceae bacterium]|nr:cytochrome c peroxidase [Catalimonadaceae bacterium]